MCSNHCFAGINEPVFLSCRDCIEQKHKTAGSVPTLNIIQEEKKCLIESIASGNSCYSETLLKLASAHGNEVLQYYVLYALQENNGDPEKGGLCFLEQVVENKDDIVNTVPFDAIIAVLDYIYLHFKSYNLNFSVFGKLYNYFREPHRFRLLDSCEISYYGYNFLFRLIERFLNEEWLNQRITELAVQTNDKIITNNICIDFFSTASLYSQDLVPLLSEARKYLALRHDDKLTELIYSAVNLLHHKLKSDINRLYNGRRLYGLLCEMLDTYYRTCEIEVPFDYTYVRNLLYLQDIDVLRSYRSLGTCLSCRRIPGNEEQPITCKKARLTYVNKLV